MKLVVAIIRPFKFEEVKAALGNLGITGMTVTEAKSFGRQSDNTEVYRGSEYTVDFTPKLKVEFVIPDGMRDQVVNAVVQAAQTGKTGDGRIIVIPVEDIVRIRTGEQAEDIL